MEDIVRTDRKIVRAVAEIDASEPPPTGGAWTVSETLLHAILVEESVDEGFRAALEQPPGPPPPTPWRTTLARRFVLTTLRIPRGGAEAPGAVVPGAILPPEELAERQRRVKERLVELAPRVLGGSGEPPWLLHPVLGPMDFHEWTRFLVIHTDHHLRILRRDGRL